MNHFVAQAAKPVRQYRAEQARPTAKTGFRSKKPIKAQNQNDRWWFQQAGVRLLNINQYDDGSYVTLLRYTNRHNPYSEVISWKLPFKMKNIKAYLLYPYLSDEEKADKELMDKLRSVMTEAFKFENLMMFRILSIVKSLEGRHEGRTKPINTDHDWGSRLMNEEAAGFTGNSFIRDVIDKNNIKLAWIK